jgi:hypothetical protein
VTSSCCTGEPASSIPAPPGRSRSLGEYGLAGAYAVELTLERQGSNWFYWVDVTGALTLTGAQELVLDLGSLGYDAPRCLAYTLDGVAGEVCWDPEDPWAE